jgi:hypothetical protein
MNQLLHLVLMRNWSCIEVWGAGLLVKLLICVVIMHTHENIGGSRGDSGRSADAQCLSL